eukprot:5264096-Amphidinium_carterae.2
MPQARPQLADHRGLLSRLSIFLLARRPLLSCRAVPDAVLCIRDEEHLPSGRELMINSSTLLEIEVQCVFSVRSPLFHGV